ncbi:MAG: hypothetical protein MJ240_13855 [Kiritimatiellae bacterium]|nr:hypothetical protein [Kiritimatiellia bacterium]
MKRLFLCALVVGMFCLALATTPPTLVVLLRQNAPAIDGIIEEGEWRASAALTGFLHVKPRDVLAGWDYILVRY